MHIMTKEEGQNTNSGNCGQSANSYTLKSKIESESYVRRIEHGQRITATNSYQRFENKKDVSKYASSNLDRRSESTSGSNFI